MNTFEYIRDRRERNKYTKNENTLVTLRPITVRAQENEGVVFVEGGDQTFVSVFFGKTCKAEKKTNTRGEQEPTAIYLSFLMSHHLPFVSLFSSRPSFFSSSGICLL